MQDVNMEVIIHKLVVFLFFSDGGAALTMFVLVP
jgi:hypothetical protein